MPGLADARGREDVAPSLAHAVCEGRSTCDFVKLVVREFESPGNAEVRAESVVCDIGVHDAPDLFRSTLECGRELGRAV